MAVLNPAGRKLIEGGALAHLVTINEDGSPHVDVVWVGLDGDERSPPIWTADSANC